MRQASAKRAAQQRQRRAMLARTTHGPVRCQWPQGCTREAADPDERLPRSAGGSITDPDNVQLLCREHHDWKHAHPDAAKALGVTTSRYAPHSSGSVRAMPTDPKHVVLRQVPLRLPADLVDDIDARRHKVGEDSRNAWIERALRWALAQPVKEDNTVVRT